MIAATPIRDRLLEIDANARLLTELRSTPVEAFVRDPRVYKLTERCFHPHCREATPKPHSIPRKGSPVSPLIGE